MSGEQRERICRDCGVSSRDVGFPKNRPRCLPCHKAFSRTWASEVGAGRRERNLRMRYGIGQDFVDSLLKQQNHSCAICEVAFSDILSYKRNNRGTVIDHCHTRGRVRGLLCHSCNLLLGHAKDSAETLVRAADYISRHLEIPDEETQQNAEKDWESHGRVQGGETPQRKQIWTDREEP